MHACEEVSLVFPVVDQAELHKSKSNVNPVIRFAHSHYMGEFLGEPLLDTPLKMADAAWRQSLKSYDP